jgi:tetratricopeptide (TPR) repeat protein
LPQIVTEKSKKPLVATLVGVAALVLALAVGAVVVYLQMKSQAAAQYESTIKQGDEEMRLNQFSNAEQTYKSYLDKGPTGEHKYRVQLALAQAYHQAGDYSAAVKWYLEAEKSGTDLDLAVKSGLGQAAQLAGESEVSIRAYKQAIEIESKTKDPMKGEQIREYQAGIRAQGGSVD